VLGAKLGAFESALTKLTSKEELPEYLRSKTKTKGRIGRYFSTHPELEERLSFLKEKISHDLPWNYYVSSIQKMRNFVSQLFQWKILVPASAMMLAGVLSIAWQIENGRQMSEWIAQASKEDLFKSNKLPEIINKKYPLRPVSLMYYVVYRGESDVIEHFLTKGADKVETLAYLAKTKNLELLSKFFEKYQDSLSEEEYYRILKMAALTDFNEGYRYLVNVKNFESLAPTHKDHVTRIRENQSKRRAPASTNQ
jgi:hypothetical protein